MRLRLLAADVGLQSAAAGFNDDTGIRFGTTNNSQLQLSSPIGSKENAKLILAVTQRDRAVASYSTPFVRIDGKRVSAEWNHPLLGMGARGQSKQESRCDCNFAK